MYVNAAPYDRIIYWVQLGFQPVLGLVHTVVPVPQQQRADADAGPARCVGVTVRY